MWPDVQGVIQIVNSLIWLYCSLAWFWWGFTHSRYPFLLPWAHVSMSVACVTIMGWCAVSLLTLISSQTYFKLYLYLQFHDKTPQNTQKHLQEFSCIFNDFIWLWVSIFCIILTQLFSFWNLCTNISVGAGTLATWWAWALTGAKVSAGKYMQVRHTHRDSSPQCLTPTEELIL